MTDSAQKWARELPLAFGAKWTYPETAPRSTDMSRSVPKTRMSAKGRVGRSQKTDLIHIAPRFEQQKEVSSEQTRT